MDLPTSLKELDISLDSVELTKLDQNYIKTQYHKMALKWHPDKNKKNDKYSTTKFQRINEAYIFLQKELNIINETYIYDNNTPFVSSNDLKDPKMNTNIFNVISSVFNETLVNIIKDICFSYDDITFTFLKDKLKTLDKQQVIEMYQLLYKYKDVLHILEHTLELVSSVVKDKCKNDHVYILNTNLKDIIEHNIYKLYVDEQLYLVPLWHNELYFDAPDGTEIIVLCHPILPPNITIDEHNNIIVNMTIHMTSELIDKEFVSIDIGEKYFHIPLNQLCITKEQVYKFKSQGIARIVQNSMYNITHKSDIIINILLGKV